LVVVGDPSPSAPPCDPVLQQGRAQLLAALGDPCRLLNFQLGNVNPEVREGVTRRAGQATKAAFGIVQGMIPHPEKGGEGGGGGAPEGDPGSGQR
jgi:hypothetical protein